MLPLIRVMARPDRACDPHSTGPLWSPFNWSPFGADPQSRRERRSQLSQEVPLCTCSLTQDWRHPPPLVSSNCISTPAHHWPRLMLDWPTSQTVLDNLVSNRGAEAAMSPSCGRGEQGLGACCFSRARAGATFTARRRHSTLHTAHCTLHTGVFHKTQSVSDHVLLFVSSVIIIW